jgi:hypothetical protein
VRVREFTRIKLRRAGGTGSVPVDVDCAHYIAVARAALQLQRTAVDAYVQCLDFERSRWHRHAYVAPTVLAPGGPRSRLSSGAATPRPIEQ